MDLLKHGDEIEVVQAVYSLDWSGARYHWAPATFLHKLVSGWAIWITDYGQLTPSQKAVWRNNAPPWRRAGSKHAVTLRDGTRVE